MANIQENSRFALNSIARDARVSGYQGCVDINSSQLNVNSVAAPVTAGGLRATSAHASLITANGIWNPPSPVGFTPSTAFPPVPGTHTLMFQFGDQRVASIASPMLNAGTIIPNQAAPVTMDRTMSEMGLAVGDLAIIANCDVGDLFTVTAGSAGSTLNHAAGPNNNANLSIAYGLADTMAQTQIAELNTHVYYVGNTGLTNANGDMITALYRQNWPFTVDNPPTELVQGVENMRVAFGIDTNGNGSLSYLPPDDANFNPVDVHSVQVGLLMNSWDRVSQDNDTTTYELAGQPIVSQTEWPMNTNTHAGDTRFRLAFNTTIKIRNRR